MRGPFLSKLRGLDRDPKTISARICHLLVGVVWLWGASALAAPPARPWTTLAYPPSFEHISVEHGLSQSTVHTMAQDKAGFLWMGTEAGLNRYDGFRFQTFRPETDNPRSFAGDWIERIVPDRHGTLWISARNAGLMLVDHESLSMFRIPITDAPGGLPARTVNGIVEDREGAMWIATESDGLWRVDKSWAPPALPRFERIAWSTGVAGAPPDRVSALFIDHAGGLWLTSPERGLGHLVPGREARPVFEYLPHDPNRPNSSCPTMVNVIAEDSFGKLWLGADQGLFIFDPVSTTFTRWSSSSFPQGTGRVLDVLRDTKNTLWVAGDGLGLFKALPRPQRDDAIHLENFVHDAKDAGSLSRNGLQCVFEDRSGMLWVSAYQGGVNKLILHPGSIADRERPSVYQYRNNAADPGSLSGDTISAIGEDRFGNLWIGTDGFGLNRLAAPKAPGQPARFERFRRDPTGGPGSLQADVILSTHLDDQKRLWLGSYMGGMVRVDQDAPAARPTFVHFRHDPKDSESLSSDFVRDMVDDGQGGFWVACDSGGGMNHFDPRTGKAKRYGMGQGPHALQNAHLMRMVKDGYGTLWIATQLGLHRFNPATEEFRVYKPGGPHAPSDAFINTVVLTSSDVLWIGTRSGGLNRTEIPPWDGPEPRFSVYGKAEGLPAESVLGILADGKGDLWLATPRAIGRFDTHTLKGSAFTFQRELRRAEFIWNAAYLGQQGEMFFGSNDGLTVFHPDDIVPNPVAPALAFTGFQVRNQQLSLRARMGAASGSGIPQIVLAPGESMFSLEFAALHFAAPDQNQYAYRLEGLDQGWNEIGNRHSVTYSALPPGQYLLSVRATNCDGVSSRGDLRLGIRMLPPWYATWWFRALLALSLVFLLYALIRFRMRVLGYHNRQLSQLVDDRTRELALVNEALRNQSITDPLTGLRNRRLLDSSMPEWVATVERQQRAVTCQDGRRMNLNIDMIFIMIDIDHFKQVNDVHGHQAGDRVLQKFGDILRSVTRTTDTVARWGGEEFLIVARNAARANASAPVERIRKAVEGHVFDIGAGKTIRCTCSLGFSVFPLVPGDTTMFSWEQIVAIADTCLYATKHNGRNAWVGLVPLAKPAPGTVIPRLPTDLVRSDCFTLLTSFGGPLKWSD
jgi:diguanylate cyclase (GGDEF)-like protein